MSPKAAAAIGLRIIGVWLLLEAIFGLMSVFLIQPEFLGLLGMHRRWYDGNTTITAPNFYLHDTYYVVSHFGWSFAGIVIHFAIGLVLLFASKPIGRLLARKLDTF